MTEKTLSGLRKIAETGFDQAMAEHQRAVDKASSRGYGFVGSHTQFQPIIQSPAQSQQMYVGGHATNSNQQAAAPERAESDLNGVRYSPSAGDVYAGGAIGLGMAGIAGVSGLANMFGGFGSGNQQQPEYNVYDDPQKQEQMFTEQLHNANHDTAEQDVLKSGSRVINTGFAMGSLKAAPAAAKWLGRNVALRMLPASMVGRAGLLAGRIGGSTAAKLAARLGAKFIPGVGWAMVAGELGALAINLAGRAYANKKLNEQSDVHYNEFGEAEYRANEAAMRIAYNNMGPNRKKAWEAKGGVDAYIKAMQDQYAKRYADVAAQRARGQGRPPAQNYMKDDGL